MESRETKSLGLTLVKILAEDQLKGSLPLEKKKGPALKSFFKQTEPFFIHIYQGQILSPLFRHIYP